MSINVLKALDDMKLADAVRGGGDGCRIADTRAAVAELLEAACALLNECDRYQSPQVMRLWEAVNRAS